MVLTEEAAKKYVERKRAIQIVKQKRVDKFTQKMAKKKQVWAEKTISSYLASIVIYNKRNLHLKEKMEEKKSGEKTKKEDEEEDRVKNQKKQQTPKPGLERSQSLFLNLNSKDKTLFSDAEEKRLLNEGAKVIQSRFRYV